MSQDSPEAANGKSSVGLRKQIVAWITAVSLPVIALGTFSEALMLVEQAADRVISSFTNLPEYEDLSYLRSGTSHDYARAIFGVPQVHREITESLSAEYYFKSKYLLTLFVQGAEVSGFTVIGLKDGFAPPVFGSRAEGLGEFQFDGVEGMPGDFLVDWTKTSALYIEEVNLGEHSLNQRALLGWANYGSGSNSAGAGLGQLYNSVIMDEEVKAQRQNVRSSARPNMYGWGKVSLETVRASILSPAELGYYLAAYQR